jgi:hypothetical protein
LLLVQKCARPSQYAGNSESLNCYGVAHPVQSTKTSKNFESEIDYSIRLSYRRTLRRHHVGFDSNKSSAKAAGPLNQKAPTTLRLICTAIVDETLPNRPNSTFLFLTLGLAQSGGVSATVRRVTVYGSRGFSPLVCRKVFGLLYERF